MEKYLKAIVKELKAIRKELEKQNQVIDDVTMPETPGLTEDLFRGFNIR